MAFDSAAPINRRTVAKGIAWSVPAVAVASTAPAFAVSGPAPSAQVTDGGKIPGASCRYEGVADSNKFFGVKVTLTNNDPSQGIYLFPDTITFSLVPTQWTFSYTGPSTPIYLAPAGQAGSTQSFWFGANGNNSGYFEAAVTFCIDWGHNSVLSADPYPHPPICSGPFTFEADTRHDICDLLFGQTA